MIISERERQARDLSWPAVEVGSRVEVCDCDTAEVKEYVVVSGGGRYPGLPNSISVESPLGSAVLGCRGGDFATVSAPGGEWRVHVLRVVSDTGASHPNLGQQDHHGSAGANTPLA
jgi:transcription elongation GreA/GreB family factor